MESSWGAPACALGSAPGCAMVPDRGSVQARRGPLDAPNPPRGQASVGGPSRVHERLLRPDPSRARPLPRGGPRLRRRPRRGAERRRLRSPAEGAGPTDPVGDGAGGGPLRARGRRPRRRLQRGHAPRPDRGAAARRPGEGRRLEARGHRRTGRGGVLGRAGRADRPRSGRLDHRDPAPHPRRRRLIATPCPACYEAAPMARACAVCGKQRSVGNNVSHANNKTKRLWRPNLQRVHAKIGAGARRLLVCTRCIRSGRVLKAG